MQEERNELGKRISIFKKNVIKLTSRFTQSHTCDGLGRFDCLILDSLVFRSTDIRTKEKAIAKYRAMRVSPNYVEDLDGPLACSIEQG